MTKTAINKCPLCGGTVNIQADVSVRMVVQGGEYGFFDTEWDGIAMQFSHQVKDKNYECYCDDCENHDLTARLLPDDRYEISAEV